MSKAQILIKKIKNIFVNLMKLFVIVFGFTMLATILFLYISDVQAVTRDFLVYEIIFCFLALVPIAIVFSLPKDFNDRHFITTRLFILIFQIATLLPYGHHIGMWQGFTGGIIMAAITIFINIATPLVAFGNDAFLSNQINKKLASFNKDEE